MSPLMIYFRETVTKCMSVPQMCRCMRTSIARIPPSSRRVSRGSEPPKTVALHLAHFMGNALPIFIAGDPIVILLSKIKLIWVKVFNFLSIVSAVEFMHIFLLTTVLTPEYVIEKTFLEYIRV